MQNKLVLVSAGIAAFFLLGGSGAFGASGGVGPGDTKKATVLSGITAPDATKPISEEITNPAPYSPPAQNFIPNPFTNPNPDVLPFIPSPYILQQMEKMYNPQPVSKKLLTIEETTTPENMIRYAQERGIPIGHTGTSAAKTQAIDFAVSKGIPIGNPLDIAFQNSTKKAVNVVNSDVSAFGGQSLTTVGSITMPSAIAPTAPITVSKKSIGGQTYRSDVKAGTGMGQNSVYRTINGKKYYR